MNFKNLLENIRSDTFDPLLILHCIFALTVSVLKAYLCGKVFQ